MKIVYYYLIFINLFSFILMKIDKEKSKRNKNRISENTFVFISLIGGSLGIILSMNLFHHKVNKIKFNFFIPLILIIEILLLIYLK